MILTSNALDKILSNNTETETWVEILNKILPENGIDTKERVAAFLAQTGHESGDYKTLRENLNYSAIGLMQTWPSRFKTIDVATMYARNQEKIANKVYAGRLGNSTYEAVGDGWKYRGRGVLQVTGKSNYAECSMELFGDDTLIKNPELLEDKTNAIRAACWFWNKHHLNDLADKKDINAISKIINGGTMGLAEREKKFNLAMSIL